MNETHLPGADDPRPLSPEEGEDSGPAFRWHADQRRLAEVRAARRERAAARAARDVDAGLALHPTHPAAGATRAGDAPDDATPEQVELTAPTQPAAPAHPVGASTPAESGAQRDTRRPARHDRADDLSLDDHSLDGLSLEGLELDAAPLDAPAEPERRATEQFSILVVCTGNVCRSPYFERVLAADLADLPVSIEGAGTGALLIDRMSTGSQALLRSRGLDGGAYHPRQLTASMVRGADLVLTATREHRRAVVDELPVAAPRVFALLDFADVCRTADLTAWRGVEGARAFVEATPAGAVERRRTRSEEDAAIIDPFRQGQKVFEAMAAQADPALATVAGAVRTVLARD